MPEHKIATKPDKPLAYSFYNTTKPVRADMRFGKIQYILRRTKFNKPLKYKANPPIVDAGRQLAV
jgi:hypothetical protein